MLIWILQTGEPLPIDDYGRPMRAINLSHALLAKGHEVNLISTRFNHFTHLHRKYENREIKIKKNFVVTLVNSPGYKKNISLTRLYDHCILAFNLRKTIRNATQFPDLIFIGYPPIETAFYLTHWAMRKNIPIVLDVKDAWPQTFVNAFPKKIQQFMKMIFSPYFFMARYAMRNAQSISTIAPPFLDWCLKISKRKKSKLDFIFALTSPDVPISLENKNKDELKYNFLIKKLRNFKRIYLFAGSLNSAFNFQTIAKTLCKDSFLIVAGDGNNRSNIEKIFRDFTNVHFTGWVNHSEVAFLHRISDIVVVPMSDNSDFEMSIPNKFYDAMKFGKPILTNIKGYARDLILSREIGWIFDESNLRDLSNLFIELNDNEEEISKAAINAQNLYKDQYEFNQIYSDAVSKIENIVENNGKF